ncbi:N-acetylneuraminate synthase family protein [Desulfobacterota bacterium AH_259_B03_O07]|nr:N-acetylneuraminate synthase family protein [Desulfobacterota bacterium AH_259_B03_O07]
MRTIKEGISVGRIVISEMDPVVIIAEAACEHRGDLGEAKRLVELANAAGADIVKFQFHLPDKEMIPGSIRFWAGSMDEVLAKVNLPPEAHKELMHHCEDVGIQYLCTPFCAAAAEVLDDLGVKAFKTGSGEMTNIPMLRHIARKGKPMIVSTGMATIEEIEETVSVLKEEGARFVLMHCTSAYPPRYDQINLRFISRLKEKFGVIVGYSDHTPDMWTALGAVVIGAKVIEKHFTLDRALKGPDYQVSLEPHEFRTMVEAIQKLEDALGSEKKIHPEEQPVREWAHHSVVSLCKIPAGSVINPKMVGVKRPGWGVPAKHLEEFHGRVAKKDIPANSLLRWEDFEEHAG